MSDDLRTRLAALADEWEAEAYQTVTGDAGWNVGYDMRREQDAEHLRALLAEPVACLVSTDAPTPAQPAAPSECDCESMGGRFGAHRPECPWQIAFERQAREEAAPQGGDVEAWTADEIIRLVIRPDDSCVHNFAPLANWLAAHDAEVRASAARETAERIAGAIEDEQFATGLNWKARDAFADAARIARAEGDR